MKPDLKNIKNIIFDLGKVLLNLDFDASIKAFKDLGLDDKVLNKQQAYTDPVFYDLEVGKVSPEEFRKRVRKIVNNPGATDQEIDDAWYAMILDIPAHRVQLLQRLQDKFNLFLFSNTNEIHMERLKKEFREQHQLDFPSLFKMDFYSYKINARKPDLESYQKVIELAEINQEESLFIDDLEKNIAGARQAGLQTFWLKEGMEIADILNHDVILKS